MSEELEIKLAEEKVRTENWIETARMYCNNSDYWRKRAETAESALEEIRDNDGLDSAARKIARMALEE